jgi:FkbM family methyltransferase
MFKKIIKKFKKKFQKFYGLHEIDRLMLEFINYNNGFFIEVGANDGINQSNTLHYEKFKKWKGILIEPNYNNFLKLKKNRSSNNYFFNNAAVSFSYNKKFVEFDYLNLMTISKTLENDIKNLDSFYKDALKYLPKGQSQYSFKAPAVTLQKMMELSLAPTIIDFFSLDVEGSELEVLKGIDFKKYNFKFILIENRDLNKIKNFLFDKNYKFIQNLTEIDSLFQYNN